MAEKASSSSFKSRWALMVFPRHGGPKPLVRDSRLAQTERGCPISSPKPPNSSLNQRLRRAMIYRFFLERERSKPPRNEAVDSPGNAVLDQIWGFKDLEKIRFSGFIQAPIGSRNGTLCPQKSRKTAEFLAFSSFQVRDDLGEVAERVGFEPTVRFPAHTLSKRAP